MAQDVGVMHLGAIKRLPYGYLAVDCAKLGLGLGMGMAMRRVA